MKKRYRLVSALVVSSAVAALSTQASAFGLGDLKAAVPGAGGSAHAVSAGDIDLFIKTAQDADQMIGAASDYLIKAVGDQQVVAELQAKMTAANSIADPKEKEAAIQKAKDDEATALQKSLASKETQDKIATMNKDQLGKFGAASYTFMLGVLKDKQLASDSSGLVSGVSSNPMLVTRLPDLKNVASSVSSQVANSVKIGEGLVQLAQAGKITALPTSASDKPKEIKGDI